MWLCSGIGGPWAGGRDGGRALRGQRVPAAAFRCREQVASRDSGLARPMHSAVSSTTRESFREAPREAAEPSTPKRGAREASREAAEITPRRFQALVDGVAARIPDCMNDLGTIAAVGKALRIPQLISFELARGAIEGAVLSHAVSVFVPCEQSREGCARTSHRRTR